MEVSVAFLGLTRAGLAALRIRLGEGLVEPLAAANFTVCYGMGTMTLIPFYGGAATYKTEAKETS